MRPEKKFITAEYVNRLSNSPFFIVVDYQGLKVGPITELRKRLHQAGAEMHVVKNSIFKVAAQEAGVGDLNGALAGQLAVITGRSDLAAAAKVVKIFKAEFERPVMKFGYLDNKRLELAELEVIAELPSLDVMRAMLMGTLQAPATNLVRLLQEPATRLARVLQAKAKEA